MRDPSAVILLVVAIVFFFILLSRFPKLETNVVRLGLIIGLIADGAAVLLLIDVSTRPDNDLKAPPTLTVTDTPTSVPAFTDTPQPTLALTPAVTPVPITQIEFVVQANERRNSTGLTLVKGQHVTIKWLTGSWRAGPPPRWHDVGPNGERLAPGDVNLSFYIPEANIMALVGGIGGAPPFLCGEELSFTSELEGMLWLGTNDDDVSDNVGSLTVQISVR